MQLNIGRNKSKNLEGKKTHKRKTFDLCVKPCYSYELGSPACHGSVVPGHVSILAHLQQHPQLGNCESELKNLCNCPPLYGHMKRVGNKSEDKN